MSWLLTKGSWILRLLSFLIILVWYMTNELIKKRDNLRAFTIRCTTCMLQISKALIRFRSKYQLNIVCHLKTIEVGGAKRHNNETFDVWPVNKTSYGDIVQHHGKGWSIYLSDGLCHFRLWNRCWDYNYFGKTILINMNNFGKCSEWRLEFLGKWRWIYLQRV